MLQPIPSIVSDRQRNGRFTTLPLSANEMAAKQNEMVRLTLHSKNAQTSSIFDPNTASTGGKSYGVRQSTCCSIRGDRCMFGVHALALIIHVAFAITCLVFTAQADNPYLESTRPQFFFTRNGTFCGLQSPSLPSDDDAVPIAVVVGTGTKLNIGIMSAFFFICSAIAHTTWCVALAWDPLGNILITWLEDAFAPLRFFEYSISAPLMLTVLTMLTGLRTKDQIASIWWLCATTMFFGYLTELLSRPDPASNGERWIGDAKYGRFGSYCYRMQAHVLGYMPYIALWCIIYGFFFDVFDDVERLYGDRVDDFVPVWITTALSTTCITFSSFGVVQLVWQYRKPKYYWQTEVAYAVLSCVSKSLLGSLLLFNVLTLDRAEGGGTGA